MRFEHPLVRVAALLACLVALSAVGILFSYLVDWLEMLLMPWQRKG